MKSGMTHDPVTDRPMLAGVIAGMGGKEVGE